MEKPENMKKPLYPHMRKTDEEIWTRYLEKFKNQKTHYIYDMKIGEGHYPPDEFTPPEQKMVQDLSRLRIDVVECTSTETHIIEVTRRVTARTIGQVLSYLMLHRLEGLEVLPTRPVIVCEECNKDFEDIADGYNIEIVRV